MSAAQERAKKVSLGGAIIAAIAASSCCVGPLVLAALGIAGGGALAALGSYRPYILGATGVLLAAGFYLTYRTSSTEGDACGCEKPKAGRVGKIGLWIATAMVVVFAASPNLIACFAGRAHDAAASATATGLAHATIRVQGMDCEACSVNIRNALAKVGGLHDMTLDLRAQTIDVTYEPAPGRLQAYVAAIDELGYEVSLPNETAKSR